MDEEIKGACTDKWRQEPLNSTYKSMLRLYAENNNKADNGLIH